MKPNTTHSARHCSGHPVIHSSNNPARIFVLALIAAFNVNSPAFAEPLPAGLTASDWASIRQQAYLKASNTGAIDVFGWSVSMSGDTVVISAYAEDSSTTGVNGIQNDNNATFSGAAYVFVRDGTNWSQQAYLKASNTEANDHFGWSVAISGDTIVIGAGGESSSATGVDGDQNNNSAPASGAAYVF